MEQDKKKNQKSEDAWNRKQKRESSEIIGEYKIVTRCKVGKKKERGTASGCYNRKQVI